MATQTRPIDVNLADEREHRSVITDLVLNAAQPGDTRVVLSFSTWGPGAKRDTVAFTPGAARDFALALIAAATIVGE